MKLTNLLPIRSEQPIMEGVTFGQSEMNKVKQAGNVYIGIEYEFTLSEVDDMEDERNEFIERREEELKEHYMDELRSKYRSRAPDEDTAADVIYDSLVDIKNIRDGIAIIEQYIDLGEYSEGNEDVNDLDENEYGELTDALQNIAVALDDLDDKESDLDDLADEIDESFTSLTVYQTTISFDDLHNLSETISIIPDFSSLTSVDDPFKSSEVSDQNEVFETYLTQGALRITESNNLGPLISITKANFNKSRIEQQIEAEIQDWIDQEADDDYERDYEEMVRGEAQNEAEMYYPDGIGDNEEHAERAEQLLDDYGDVMDSIERVYPDGPPPLAEAVGIPLPITEAIDHMYEMLDFIKEHGYTDNRAGMHVNMSLSDSDMSMEDFNPIKLVILMDDGYVNDNFPKRDYTGPVFSAFDSHKLMTIVENMVSAGSNPEEFDQGIVKEIESLVKRGSNLQGKGTNFNINGVTGETNPSKRRVEFRYFGGVTPPQKTAGYEYRGEGMEFEIYRAAYSLMAAFDENFLRREYIESLWNFVDDRVEEVYNSSLSDLFSWVNEAYRLVKKNLMDEENYDEMLIEVRNNPKNMEAIFQNNFRAAQGKKETDLNPDEQIKKIVNANSEDIEDDVDEYFEILASVVEKGKWNSMKAVEMSLSNSRLFSRLGSGNRLELLSLVIGGDKRTDDRDVQSMIRDIAVVIMDWWLEEQADRDMLRRFDKEKVRRAVALAIIPHVEEYLEQGTRNRTLDDLRDQIDFIRLG